MKQLFDRTEVILLDIDGTILDFAACVKEIMQSGFKKFGLPAYEPWMFDVFIEINEQLWKQLERKEITFQELIAVRWNRILDALGMDFDGPVMEQYFRQNLMSSAIPVKGAGELLRTLSGRFELGMASNGPYEQQRNRLSVAGFADFFTYFFVSQRVGYSKPDPRFFEAAINGINEDRARRGKAAL
jgi:FMN phosphatase YigB (HAD superfamily)